MANHGGRRQGAGRKSKKASDRTGKTSNFSTRLDPHLRERLEVAAKRNNHSLSQEISDRLIDSLNDENPSSQEHVKAFATLCAMIVERVESGTNLKWRDDPFTWEAVDAAIRVLLVHLRPIGETITPRPVVEKNQREQSIIAVPQEVAEFYLSPPGEASRIALGLIDQLQHTTAPAGPQPKNIRYAKEFYVFPRLRKALNIPEPPKGE